MFLDNIDIYVHVNTGFEQREFLVIEAVRLLLRLLCVYHQLIKVLCIGHDKMES